MAEQVGSAYIPVRPDFRGFHQQVQRELQRILGPILTRIGQQASEQFSEGFEREQQRQDPMDPLRRQQQQDRRRQRDEGARQAGAFGAGFERALRQAAASLPNIPIGADSSDADRALQELRSRMEILSRARIGVDISADDAMQQLEEIQRELQQTAEGADINVQADVAVALQSLNRFSDEITRLRGEHVEVEVDADTDRARRGLDDLDGSSREAGIGMGLLSAALGAVRFAPMAAGAGLAAGGLVQMVSALGPLIGLAAALPAVLAAKTVALQTLKLALYGVSDAFNAALTGDAEEFAESLEKLSPAARAVATEMRTLRPQLMGIQQAAQQAMFAPLQGELTRLTAALAGPVRSGVRGVAGEFGLAGQQIARFAASGRGVTVVNSVFTSLTESLRRLRPALDPLVAGIASFVAAGSSGLMDMSSSLAQVATAFGGWLQRVSDSGQVMGWISGALDVARALGPVFVDLGQIVAKVFSAMSSAGGGGLGVIGVVLDQLNAFLSSAEGSSALASFFAGITALGRALGPIIPLAGHLVAQLVAGLLPVVQALSPVLSVLVGALGQVLRSLTPILVPIGQLIAGLISGLLPVLQPVIALFAQVAAQIGGALVAALQASLPSLQQLVLSVASLLPALMPMIPLLAQWLTTFLPLLPAVTQLAALLVGYLVPPLRLLIQLWVTLNTTALGLVIPVLRLVVGVIVWAAGLIAPLLAGLGVAVRALGAAGLWLWQSAIQPAFRGIATLAGWLYSVVTVVLVTPLLLAFKLIQVAATFLWRNVFGPVFRGIGAVVRAAWTGVISPVFMAIVNALRNVLAPPIRWLYNSVVKPIFTSVGSAIRSVWTGVIQPVFNALRSAVGKLGGAFDTGVSAIKKAWDKLRDAAKKPVAFVVNTVFNSGIVKIWNAVAKLVPGVKQLSEIKGFARGGVVGGAFVPAGAYGALAGYAPGRDSMIAAVSPGESWMRPEWTRAVGPKLVNLWNDIARRQGPQGVRRWFTGSDRMGAEGMAFADGGTVPGGPRFAGAFGLGGIVKGFLGAAKNWFMDGLVNAGRKALNPLLDLAQRAIGGTAFGDLAVGTARGLADKVLGFVSRNEDRIGGGPGAGRGLAWARTQAGKPYGWGAVGPHAYDCSGLWSALVNVIRGRSPHSRLFTTFSFGASGGPGGFVRNLASAVRVGVTNSGVGHMAGTIGKTNIESSGSAGVRVGGGARGWNDPLFTHHYGLKFDSGGWLQPGLTLVNNATGRPEPVLTRQQLSALQSAAAVRTGTVGGTTYNIYPQKADWTVADLQRMQRREAVLNRVGRPV